MWKSFRCKVPTGQSGYIGFAAIYENILTFLLENGDGEEYYQLVHRNRATFDTFYSCIAKNVKGVYEKSYSTTKEEERSHAGLGKEGLLNTNNDNATRSSDGVSCADDGGNELRHIKLVEPRELLNLLYYIEHQTTRLSFMNRPSYIPNVLYLNLLVQMEDNGSVACLLCGRPNGIGRYPTIPRVKDLICHRPFCPTVWLENKNNTDWRDKRSMYPVIGGSKFVILLEFLTLMPRPREIGSWMFLIQRLQMPTPGATQCTLRNLLRIACHERLVMTLKTMNGCWETSRHHLYAPDSIEDPPVYVSGHRYYRLLFLQGFLLPVVEPPEPDPKYVCLYCGANYRRQLSSEPLGLGVYFSPEQAKRLLAYALYGVGGQNSIQRYVYGRHLPTVLNFEALMPSDLEEVDPTSIEEGCTSDEEYRSLGLALMSLSSTLDKLHKEDCMFRIKKRFTSTSSRCPICMCDFDSDYKMWCSMVCGHRYCESCYNDIRMTDCVVCKRGYRDEPMFISNSVNRGYIYSAKEFL